ncbi:MMPL family transporter, partial [Streptomyces sp. SID6648]|nr:MMPL family transporter [Streptomyces sp. SID6648]
FTLPSSQSQQGLDVLQRHDPAAGGYSAQIVVHDGDQTLTSLDSPMATAVGALQKLPHVLAVQNPLTAGPASGSPDGHDEGPLSADGRTGYLTVRFDIQPARLGDGYLDGVDDAVRPLRS